MKKTLAMTRFLMLFFGGLLASQFVSAQCAFQAGYINYGNVTPAGPGITVTQGIVWGGDHYTLDAIAGEEYTVSFCLNAPSWDTQVTIFDETDTQVAFNDDACGVYSEVTFTAATTGAYTIQVEQFDCTTNTGPGIDMEVSRAGTPPPAAGGDDCATAEVIACGDSFTGSTTGAPSNPPVVPSGGTAYGTGGGQWFQFTGTGDNVTVSLCGSSYDTKIHVVSGDCTTQAFVAANDDSFASCGGTQSEVSFDSVLGTNYYFYVNGFGANEGDFLINITCLAPLAGCTNPGACNFDPAATADDGTCEFTSCAGCTDPGACNFVVGNTIEDGSCDYSCVGCTDPSATNGGSFSISEPAACVFCNAGERVLTIVMTDSFGDGWNGNTLDLLDANTGTTVVSVDLDSAPIGDGASFGSIDVCVDPNGCYVLNAGGGTFVGEIGWSISDDLGNDYGSGGAATNVSFDVGLDGDCGFPGCTDSAAANFNPSAGVDDGSCVFPPANNEVCNAEAVTCGSTVTGTTIDATDDSDLIGTICSGAEITSPGVWYLLNSTVDQQVTASLCNTAVFDDSKIHIYEAPSGDCTSLTCVAANDDFCALFSQVSWNATAGLDYYIYVTEFGTGTGMDFTLDVTCTPCASVPTNNDCVDAAALPTAGIPIAGSLCCATPSGEPNQVAGTFGTAYDVFYTVNSGTFDDLFIDLTNVSNTGAIGLQIYNGTCGSLTPLAAGAALSQVAGNLSDFITLAPNTDYTFAVFTEDPSTCGDFNISITGLIEGCTDSAANNFDPLATSDDGSCDYVGVVPGNDLCAGAITIDCAVSPINGSTGGATATDAPTIAGCYDVPASGVWYVLPGNDELVTLSLCGSVIDSELNIWSAADCAGPFSCVTDIDGNDASNQGNEPACGFFDNDDASITFVATSGTNYYVYVSAETNNGAFDMEVECAPIVNGCTNSAAYNFDPLANVDDGSCDFFSQTCDATPGGTPLQLNMTDSFGIGGDGWNGATYTITAGDGTEVASGDLDGAVFSVDEDNFPGPESGFDLICLEDGCYTIVVGGGTFDGEIGFDLVDQTGASLVSGGAGEFSFVLGASTVCGCTQNGACNFDPAATDDDGSCDFTSCAGCTDPAACNVDPAATITDNSQCCFDNCVTINMTDSFGDGWDGTTYEIYTIDDVLVTSGDLDTAQNGDGLSTGSDLLCLADGCYYIVVDGGAFLNEKGWTLFGVNAGPISGGAPTTAADLVTFSVGAGACVAGCTEPVACNFDPAANISDCTACEYTSCVGCTYPDATNYSGATATIDDGSCTFDIANPCPADIDGDGIIATGDLLEVLNNFGQACP